MRNILLGASLGAVLFCSAVPLAHAGVLVTVGLLGTYATIQGGIDHVPGLPGDQDTVLVFHHSPLLSQNYEEAISFLGKNILVVGGDSRAEIENPDPSLTIIDGLGTSGPLVNLVSGEPSTAEIRGFTIRNGIANRGGGIRLIGTSPVIRKNIIQYCAAADSGGGIYVQDGSPEIVENAIEHNRVGDASQTDKKQGGGVALIRGNPALRGNRVRLNQAYGGGGGVYAYACNLTVTENRIDSNQALPVGTQRPDGGGVSYLGGTIPLTATVEMNSFTGNKAEGDGGGFRSYDGALVVVQHNIFFGDTANKNGGGIYVGENQQGAPVKIVRENLAHSCEANADGGSTGVGGGGIFFKGDHLIAEAVGNTVVHNAVVPNSLYGDLQTRGGGIAATWHAEVTVDSNKVFKNFAPFGGGIAIQGQEVTCDWRWNTVNQNQAEKGGAVVYGGGVSGSDGYWNKVIDNVGTVGPPDLISGVYLHPLPSQEQYVMKLNGNEIYRDDRYYVYNDEPNYTVPARKNWWGEYPPSSLHFSANVDYSSALDQPPHPACVLLNPDTYRILPTEAVRCTLLVDNTSDAEQTFSVRIEVAPPAGSGGLPETVWGPNQYTLSSKSQLLLHLTNLRRPSGDWLPGLNRCRVVVNPLSGLTDSDFFHFWVWEP